MKSYGPQTETTLPVQPVLNFHHVAGIFVQFAASEYERDRDCRSFQARLNGSYGPAEKLSESNVSGRENKRAENSPRWVKHRVYR
jgi:hypothetical protein